MILRPVEEKDNEKIVGWRNDPRVSPFFFETFHFTVEAQKEWFQKYQSRLDREIYFVIEIGGQGIGTVSIKDMVGGRGEVARFLIAPEYQGYGYGKQALCHLVGYAKEKGVDVLYANIYEHNAASRRSFEKVGFELIKTENGICYYELELKCAG